MFYAYIMVYNKRYYTEKLHDHLRLRENICRYYIEKKNEIKINTSLQNC